jgi:uncharacterized protein
MEKIPDNITSFLRENKVATICFNDTLNRPLCINCFYTYDEGHRVFIFKSSHNSFQEEFIRDVTKVAGSILPDNVDFLKPRGIQFTGATLCQAEIDGLDMAKTYYSKYPFGRVMPGFIWAIRPDFIKLTDKTNGFGGKTFWSVYAKEGVAV